MPRNRTTQLVGPGLLCALVACGANRPQLNTHASALESTPLVVSEVAHATSYAGSTADKVEVYCASASGCEAYKVCDSTSTGGASCSAVAPALASHQRAVVSRGTGIAVTDEVWLADSAGTELPGTRVGPFNCASGQSMARSDCAMAAFLACAAPELGTSAGSCDSGDFPETFRYSVKFTTNQHGLPEATCNRPVCQELVRAIDRAERSIDFAIYGLRSQPAVLDALIAAQARGVVVRGVVDSENATCSAFGYPDTPELIAALEPGSVVCDLGSGYSYIMHNKFFVFDGYKVWTGSTNLSDTELGGEYNSDVAAMLSSIKLAQLYEAEFDEMFNGQFHARKLDNTPHVVDGDHFTDGTVVRSYFSPTDRATDNAVIPLIQAANHTLDIAMFFFTSQSIADAIGAAQARGVNVRMILDAGGAANAYSKHGQLCAGGIAVKTENWGGKSHSKWAVADAAYPSEAAVVFGSMNWTGAGDIHNDENTLYVKNAGFAAAFEAEFHRQWSDLAAVPVCTTVSAEGSDSSVYSPTNSCARTCTSGSCCDGLDNDYDGRVDLAEEACACADGIDNDEDGYVDAEDYDCKNLPDP